jgi:hypothetical protein
MKLQLARSFLLATLLAPWGLVHGQTIGGGIKLGSQLTDAIATSAPYNDVPFRKLIGGAFEVSLPSAFAVEMSAFKQDPTYDSTIHRVAPEPDVQGEIRVLDTTIHLWEVPIVAKKYFVVANRARVFADLGIVCCTPAGLPTLRQRKAWFVPFPGLLLPHLRFASSRARKDQPN